MRDVSLSSPCHMSIPEYCIRLYYTILYHLCTCIMLMCVPVRLLVLNDTSWALILHCLMQADNDVGDRHVIVILMFMYTRSAILPSNPTWPLSGVLPCYDNIHKPITYVVLSSDSHTIVWCKSPVTYLALNIEVTMGSPPAV